MKKQFCKETSKVCFPNELEAKLALLKAENYDKINAHQHFEIRPIRAYQCPFCKQWHLTHQSYNRKKVID